MIFALLFPLWLAAAADATPVLLLRDGTTYRLKQPPRNVKGRLVFETIEGKVYSIDPREVREQTTVSPTATPPQYSTHDSKALGAIAREGRERKGMETALAPRVRRTRTPTPRPPQPPSSPGSGKGSPG